MKGFTPTGRGPKMGHSFDSSFGFTGSSGTVRPVKPHMRSAPKPMQKAEGGDVKKLAGADKDSSLLSGAKKKLQGRQAQLDEAIRKAEGYADGGKVSSRKSADSATIGREEASNQLDEETGGKTPLRPGFKRGGPMKKATGGPVAAAKGGKIPKGSVGSFNRKPLVGRC
jgi:hypothetical protein